MPKKSLKKVFKKTELRNIGHLVFVAGIALTLVFTLMDPTKLAYIHGLILLALGLVVGLLDVPKKDAISFLVAVIALILVAGVNFQQITYHNIGPYIKGFFLNAALFLGLAGAVVALKIVYRVYKQTL